jgi:hypothetical protein
MTVFYPDGQNAAISVVSGSPQTITLSSYDAISTIVRATVTSDVQIKWSGDGLIDVPSGTVDFKLPAGLTSLTVQTSNSNGVTGYIVFGVYV